VWEETRVPGENPRGRAGDGPDLPTYDTRVEPALMSYLPDGSSK